MGSWHLKELKCEKCDVTTSSEQARSLTTEITEQSDNNGVFRSQKSELRLYYPQL